MLEQFPQEVKIFFKQFPLRSHKFSYKAALATIAAHEQGKFWEFHDLVFENYNQLNDAKIEEIRNELSLNKAQFQALMKDPQTSAQINADVREGQRAGVRSTPTVFVNGKRLRDRRLAGFQEAIKKELNKPKTNVK